jgi:hypothetical protein
MLYTVPLTCILLFTAFNINLAYPTASKKGSSTHTLPFTKKRPPIHNDENKRSYDSSTSIYNDNQVQYLVNIMVGTPPQEFTVIVDTGR